VDSIIFSAKNKPFEADQSTKGEKGLDCRRALSNLGRNIRGPEIKLIELQADEEAKRGEKSLADQANAGDMVAAARSFHGNNKGGCGLIRYLLWRTVGEIASFLHYRILINLLFSNIYLSMKDLSLI
jgi:hypothetical protein